MIGLKQLLSNEPLWKRPVPICGSVYSKFVFLISLNYINEFMYPREPFGPHDPRLAIVGMLFFTIGGLMMVFELTSIRKQRNHAAGDLYKMVAETLSAQQKIPTEFSLYLRRFNAEPLNFSFLPPIHPTLIDQSLLPNTFEAFLSDQMHGWCPLVGLGRLEETVGAGKISSSDAEWQTKIGLLFQSAKIIFLVPAVSPGTMWEVRQILDNRALLSKTLVLARPALFGKQVQDEWRTIQETYLKEFGCKFPDYSPKGLVFSLCGGSALEPYPIGAKRKNLQIRKTLLQLDLVSADALEMVNREYPTKCTDWVVSFILLFLTILI